MAKSYQYIEGFVVPVPKKNLKQYKKWAKTLGQIWLKHGALSYVECMSDDLQPGKITSFQKSVKLKKDEVVFFSWVTYKSKSDRKRIVKTIMSDPKLQAMFDEMPFDGMRMIWGGFKPVIQL